MNNQIANAFASALAHREADGQDATCHGWEGCWSTGTGEQKQPSRCVGDKGGGRKVRVGWDGWEAGCE